MQAASATSRNLNKITVIPQANTYKMQNTARTVFFKIPDLN